MKAATMFSGIGAPEVAMPHWNWLWHAEIEKFPNAVMAHHHPQSTNLGDVNGKRFVERAEERGRPDVLVFGSPCQSFSVAGRRLGLDDPRGNLALVALGIVARLKPGWFVFENVPGLLSSDKGRDWGLFLRTVDELGYAGAWASLDAQFFGLAQRRERLFFVGSSGDWRGPAAVLFEPESVCGHSPPSRAQRERVAPTVEARANGGGGGWGTDFLAGGGLTEVADIAWALQERDSKGVDSDTKDGHLIIAPVVSDPIQANESRTYSLAGNNPRPRNIVATPILEAGARTGRVGHEERDGIGIGEPNDPMFTLQGSKQHAVAFAENQRAEVRTADTVGALNNGGGKPGQGYPAVCFKPSHYTRDKDGAPSDVTPPLSKEADKGDQEAVVFQTRIARNGRGQPSEVVPALNGADAGTTSDMRPCVFKTDQEPESHGDLCPTLQQPSPSGGGQQHAVMAASTIRRLTPRECERLQGFPDDYTLVSYRGKPAADGPRYKALGNSMAVPVVRWILSRIEAIEKKGG
jgi:DNA (cytosine-5)-methyltransferase 1